MSIFTLTEIEEQLAAYKAALKAVSKGQEYWIDGEKLTRAELSEIRNTLDWLGKEKSRLTGKRAGVLVRGRVAR